jgi:hypothetical protein
MVSLAIFSSLAISTSAIAQMENKSGGGGLYVWESF